MTQYAMVEIFESIQGEGTNMGIPCTFIRLAGCNLNCPWCDTDWKRVTGVMTEEEIVEKINFKLPLIVITGGEPFMQDMVTLVKTIRRVSNDITIAFETNGTFPTDRVSEDPNVWITCSPKPQKNWQINPLCFYDELKYVIDDNIKLENITDNVPNVWLQPLGQKMQASWKKCLRFTQQNPQLRIGVQLHKIMEVR